MCSSDRRFLPETCACGNSLLLLLVGSVVLALGAPLLCGCAILWPASPPRAEDASKKSFGDEKSTAAVPSAAQSSPVAANASNPDKLSEELQKLGTLWDQQTKEKLLEDLRQTDPSLWPAVIQQYKAVANYCRNARSEEAPREAGSSVAAQGGTASLPNALKGEAPESNPEKPYAAGQGNRLPDGSVASRTGPTRLPPPGETILPPESVPGGQYVTTGYPSLGQPDGTGYQAGQSACCGTFNTRSPQSAAAAGGTQCDGAGVSSAQTPSTTPALYGPWHAHVDAATRALEAELGADLQAGNSLRQLARLSLLYLVSGRREEALRILPGSASAEADYWRKQVYALAVWLDEQREADGQRRAAQTRLALDEALARLADAAPLVVRNLVFCTEVQSYGCYKAVTNNEFAPEQEVLLYAEIENFASEETPRGFYTKLRSSYQIFDARGQTVAEYDGTVTEDYCRNRRRDYFNCYHLRLPARIYPGKHTLRLTVEDMIGQKVGQSSIDLTIKEAAVETATRRRGLR